MHLISKLAALVAVSAALSACDPVYKTTAQKCALNQEAAVIIGVPSYEVTAGTDEYKLYFEDTILALEPASTLTGDELAAFTFIKGTIDTYLSYNDTTGAVTSSSNALDFLESVVATTDSNVVIDAFAIAKQQVAAGVAADDGFCSYSNDNIVLTDGSPDVNVRAYAELSISYDPFQRIVQQSILISEVSSDLDNSTSRQSVPYVGFFQTNPSDFKAVGFTEAQVRQAIVRRDGFDYESLSFDDGRDTKLGQILLDYTNLACDLASTSANVSDYADCPAGTVTRAPALTECAAEANKLATYSFNFGSLTNLKRLRVEADYTTGLVEIYTSEYREAIYDVDVAGINTVAIEDPTDCEKQAVLDKLAAANPGVGVRLTTIPDPNYDTEFVTDSNGDPVLDGNGDQQEIAPVPILTYTGTIVPSRS